LDNAGFDNEDLASDVMRREGSNPFLYEGNDKRCPQGERLAAGDGLLGVEQTWRCSSAVIEMDSGRAKESALFRRRKIGGFS
jgi:hypothetical protein